MLGNLELKRSILLQWTYNSKKILELFAVRQTPTMRPLHPIDFIFLSLEKRQQPMHVGGLFLFQIPNDAPSTFIQDLVTDIRTSKMIPIPPFNNRLNGFFWDEDE